MEAGASMRFISTLFLGALSLSPLLAQTQAAPGVRDDAPDGTDALVVYALP